MWRSGVSLASRSLTGTGLVSLPLRDVRPLAPWTAEPILSGMFLRYYLELPMPFERAEQALIAIPGSGLGALVDETGDQAERLLAEVGFTVAERRISREVAISFRGPRRLGRGRWSR